MGENPQPLPGTLCSMTAEGTNVATTSVHSTFVQIRERWPLRTDGLKKMPLCVNKLVKHHLLLDILEMRTHSGLTQPCGPVT